MTIKNFEVKENDFVASGSEWQTAADNGYSGPAYCFTYGLFGTLYAKPGETVTVSNLTVKDVNVNLNGATETIGGQKVAAISDMAGIIAGYTQGNVTFKISRWTAPPWKAKKVRSPATTALPPSSADAAALRRMRRITIPFSLRTAIFPIFPFTASAGLRRSSATSVWARIFPSKTVP